MEKTATVTFHELDTVTQSRLVWAASEFLGRCMADPDHKQRIQAYKQKLIKEGRWPLPGMDQQAIETKGGRYGLQSNQSGVDG